MKKILITIVAVLSCNLLFAQQSKAKSLEPEKTMSASETNQLNGKAEPTINGKPYSQWVIEQKVILKQKEISSMAAQRQIPNLEVSTVTVNDIASTANPASAKAQTKRLPATAKEADMPKMVKAPVTKAVVNKEQLAEPLPSLQGITITAQEAAAQTKSAEPKKIQPVKIEN